MLVGMLACALCAGCGSGPETGTTVLPTAHVVPQPTFAGVVVPAPARLTDPVAAPRTLASPVAPTSQPATPTRVTPSRVSSPKPEVVGEEVDPLSQTPEVEPATPPGEPAPLDPTADHGELHAVAAREAQLVETINAMRSAHGLPPYVYSSELSAAARRHSCDLAAHGLISHSSSDGRTLAERLAGSQPAWQWPSENIAVGLDDPEAVVALWMDEPPDGWHRRNILDTQQQEVGVGYCYNAEDPSGNQHYWTADFSRRA